MTTAAATLVYVYGIVGTGQRPPDVEGIGGGEISTVTHGELSALIGEVSPDARALGGRQAMAAHARVLEAAFVDGPVLPMRFATVLDDAETVRINVLERHGEHLARQPHELAGAAEYKLRGTYEEDRLMREVLASDPELLRMRDALRGTSPDATYYARIELGERVSAAVARRREQDAQAILDRLAPHVREITAREPGHERVVLNAAILVDQATTASFDAELESIGRDEAGRIALKLTGPLPPHSFVALPEEG